MPKLDLTRALRIKAAGGELARLKGAGFTWPSLTLQVKALFATLGATNGAMYDATASATLWQDTAGTTPAALTDPIGRMNDLSGFGNHQLQATATARPTRAVGGASFDGVDDLLSCTFASAPATSQNHYLARSWAVDGWTGTTSVAGMFRLHTSSTVYIRQAGRADSAAGTKTLVTDHRNGSTPAATLATINPANYAIGVLTVGESLVVPDTSVNVSKDGSEWTTTAFTGTAANTFTSLGFTAAGPTAATLFAKTERRSIWIAGPNAPDATQRALIRAWLEET